MSLIWNWSYHSNKKEYKNYFMWVSLFYKSNWTHGLHEPSKKTITFVHRICLFFLFNRVKHNSRWQVLFEHPIFFTSAQIHFSVCHWKVNTCEYLNTSKAATIKKMGETDECAVSSAICYWLCFVLLIK